MKKIKFRAWEKGETMGEPFTLKEAIVFFDWEDPITMENIKDAIYLQWTGEVDKNGKEIYDGDVLKEKDGYIRLVDDIRNTNRTNSACYCNTAYSKKPVSEIIGNIYENPELLEELEKLDWI